MGNDQILPSKAPLEEICISEILGISLASFRGLIYNKSPFQLRSQRSEQRSKADSQVIKTMFSWGIHLLT
ncbi:hypothetical protein V6Z11_A10G153700 [Gossypium hirsutum]